VRAGTQRTGRRRLGDAAGAGLAVPGKTIPLLPVVDLMAERLAQGVEVYLPPGENVGEEAFEFFNIPLDDVGRCAVCFVTLQ